MTPQEEILHLRQQLQAKDEELRRTRVVMVNRGSVLLGELIDACNLISQQAAQGDLNCKQQAQGLLDALKNLQQVSGRLIVVKGN